MLILDRVPQDKKKLVKYNRMRFCHQNIYKIIPKREYYCLWEGTDLPKNSYVLEFVSGSRKGEGSQRYFFEEYTTQAEAEQHLDEFIHEKAVQEKKREERIERGDTTTSDVVNMEKTACGIDLSSGNYNNSIYDKGLGDFK